MIGDPCVERDASEQDRCVESHKKSSVIIERKKALGKAHHVGGLNIFSRHVCQ